MSESNSSGLFAELKRRNIFRVAIAYVIVTWLLLQVVDILVPMLALPEWVGRLVFLLLLIGFPVAVFFAWAFELTPEGVKLERDVDRSESITNNTGRKLDYVIIAVLVVALGISLFANFDEDSEMEPAASDNPSPEFVATSVAAASIAVLPFTNRSSAENDKYFVDGMHDDLLTQLSKISALKVISRTSVLQYRDTEKSMKLIGDELGVTTLLEGGVQRAGNRIRINVQLIDADTDEHLWAETYNRELTADNIFEIQEEMSFEIANALHAALSPEEHKRLSKRPTENLEAYEAYLIGRQRLATRNMPDVDKAIEYFELAIERDSNFAQAYASIAEARMVQNNAGVLSLEAMLEYARPAVDKAMSINPDLGMVYNVVGGLAEYDGDLDLARMNYEKAIEIEPSYITPYIWLALLHANYTGDLEEAARLYETARELDPVATLPKYNHGIILAALGEPDEALAILRKAVEDEPESASARMFLAEVLILSFGRYSDGLTQLQRAALTDVGSLDYAGFIYAELGDFETAGIWSETYTRDYPDGSFSKNVERKILLAEGKLQEAAELAEIVLGFARDTIYEPELLRSIRDFGMSVNETDGILEQYRKFYPELFRASPDVHRVNVMAAVDLVLLLKDEKEENRSVQLAQKVLWLMESMPLLGGAGIGFLEVELHAILGNRDAAIEALRTVNNAGLILYWDEDLYYPNLANVVDDPEFRRLMGLIQERGASELQKIRELEDAGRLARTPDELSGIVFDLN